MEIHTKASDWFRHGHHLDAAYNNVILHLVADYDTAARDSRGRQIPTLILPPSCLARPAGLIIDPGFNSIPCLPESSALGQDLWESWLKSLYRARLSAKMKRVISLDHGPQRNWENTLYLFLGSNFGLPINVLPFHLTLLGLPEKELLSLRDEPRDLEALLFGQSGLLPSGKHHGPYVKDLKKRFTMHGNIPQSPPLEPYLWKFLRLRPASFPTLRISQFAMLLHRHFPILETLLDLNGPGEIESLLKVSSTAYWNTAYRFGSSSPEIEKVLGKQARANLVVNAIAPFLMCFGQKTGSRHALELGKFLMAEGRAETNQITRLWTAGGIFARNSMESQALIYLYNTFCKQKRCYDCQIGRKLYSKHGE